MASNLKGCCSVTITLSKMKSVCVHVCVLVCVSIGSLSLLRNRAMVSYGQYYGVTHTDFPNHEVFIWAGLYELNPPWAVLCKESIHLSLEERTNNRTKEVTFHGEPA